METILTYVKSKLKYAGYSEFAFTSIVFDLLQIYEPHNYLWVYTIAYTITGYVNIDVHNIIPKF